MEKTRKDIIWIASYPKCGNTWIRTILANILFGDQKSMLNIEDLIPDIDLNFNEKSYDGSSKVFVKTHYYFGMDFPVFRRTAGFIYIIRHPLDIMLSALNFHFLITASPENPSCSLFDGWSDEKIATYKMDFFKQFIMFKGWDKWVDMGYGNIPVHVDTWLSNTYNFPHIIVKYEDLISNTKPEVNRICNFIGTNLNSDTIDKTIANSSFSALQKMETQESTIQQVRMFSAHPGHKLGYRFMNKGKAEQWKKMLPPHVINSAKDVFAPVLERFGYH